MGLRLANFIGREIFGGSGVGAGPFACSRDCRCYMGFEVSRPAGYPDGPLLRTGLAELPHPAPDRSVSPHIFSECSGTVNLAT